MEKQITVNSKYNSLESLLSFLKKESTHECSTEYDSWEVRTDAKGQMEKCIVLKKSEMHGMKIYFSKENELKMTYIIPNKLMHAYFGKSQKRYRNILEIITGAIKNTLLASSQQKAFEEMTQVIDRIAA
jgi:hypothetical protein